MSSGGRKKDVIWTYFEEIKEPNQAVRAKCKKCNQNMVALVARLKKHVQKCVPPPPSECLQQIVEVEDLENDTDSNDDLPLTEVRDKYKPDKRKRQRIDIARGSASTSSVISEVISDDVDIGTVTVTPSGSSQSSIESFIVRTNIPQKKKLDLQVARYLYATNTSFRAVEHKEFKTLINMLRPGYTPPSRYDVSNQLLNEVYNSVKSTVKQNLLNKNVCLTIDGWSNVHNDPIIGVCVMNIETEQVHLLESVDTSGHSHNAEYLLKLLKNSISKCHEEYKCNVTSVVTDNAANMAKMRNDLFKEQIQKDIITYGCSAHILNLLAHDLEDGLEIPELKEKIKKICKYFRNVHFAHAKYNEAGGSALILPQDVRWNTLADCLESYIKNWPILYNVCCSNKIVFDNEIIKMVNNTELKLSAQSYLKKLKYIAVALDKVQRSSCTISEATEIWVELLKSFEGEHAKGEFIRRDVQKIKDRLEMALTPPHYLSNLLDHRFMGENLTQSQLDIGMEYAETYYPDVMPTIINFRAKCPPFNKYMFSKQLIENVNPLAWWRSLKCLDSTIINLVEQLHTAIASSADIERHFSSYGLVHSKLRNRLGNEKAAKLVCVFRELNNSISDSEC